MGQRAPLWTAAVHWLSIGAQPACLPQPALRFHSLQAPTLTCCSLQLQPAALSPPSASTTPTCWGELPGGLSPGLMSGCGQCVEACRCASVGRIIPRQVTLHTLVVKGERSQEHAQPGLGSDSSCMWPLLLKHSRCCGSLSGIYRPIFPYFPLQRVLLQVRRDSALPGELLWPCGCSAPVP